MADARSALHWLKKGLPDLEEAFQKVAHHQPNSSLSNQS